MSVTAVNRWCFFEKADMDEGMATIRDYMEYLKANEHDLEQSLWLKSNDNHLRYFHIATYRTSEALDRQMNSGGTKMFLQRLYPLIDKKSVEISVGPVVANTGNGICEI